MDDEWNDDFGSSTPADTFSDQGRSYGKGRGFKPRTDNNDSGVGDRNGGDNDWGTRGRGGGGQGRGGGRYRDRNGDDENGSDNGDQGFGNRGFGGRGRGRGGGRGGGNRYGNDDDENGDNDGGDFHRGRGGGRGGGRGRGGNRDRDDFGGGGGGGGGGDGDKPEPINKEIYIPPEPSNEDSVLFGTGVDAGINFDKYDDIQINVTGENVPPMIQSFEEAGLRTLLEDNIRKSGYTKPTPVQKHALPIILAGRDLMACAQTGSGKTAAFVVPIVNALLNDPVELVLDSTHCEPQAVIVAPTRELATQIFDQARKFAKDSILKCVNIYGGTASFHQRQQVMRGAHILVATTGRLKDFVQRGHITFSSVRFFVLDEADRMLDLGFLPDIETIMDDATMVPTGERQTLMFSATFPPEVQQLASKFLNDYIFIAVGIVGGACSDVEQSFFEVEKFKKREKLNEILQAASAQGPIERTLIFVETKRSADFLAAYLSENSYLTTSIHGDRLQRERECALNDFKSGRMPILVATAVAARGLDIKGVAHVINYDLPNSIDEFVHRIGRTGRVGNRGRATSFFNAESDAQIVPDLVRILKQAGQEVPAWLESPGSGGGGGYGGASRGSKFGGRDVRNFNNGGGDAYPESAYSAADAEPEEQW